MIAFRCESGVTIYARVVCLHGCQIKNTGEIEGAGET